MMEEHKGGHHEGQQEEEGEGPEYGLNPEQQKVIQNAFECMDQPVTEILLQKQRMFSISTSDLLNDQLIQRIIRNAHSRIPVVWAAQKDLVLGFMRPEDFLPLEADGQKSILQLLIEEKITLDLPYYESNEASLGQVQEQASEQKSKAILVSENPKALAQQTGDINRAIAKHREDPAAFALPEEEMLPSAQLLGMITHEDLMHRLMAVRKI